VKVAIDRDLCMGHGLCYSRAPSLFVDDDEGYGHVLGDGAVDPGDADAARAAVANCPEEAISLDE
jgi:ferredoxin